MSANDPRQNDDAVDGATNAQVNNDLGFEEQLPAAAPAGGDDLVFDADRDAAPVEAEVEAAAAPKNRRFKLLDVRTWFTPRATSAEAAADEALAEFRAGQNNDQAPAADEAAPVAGEIYYPEETPAPADATVDEVAAANDDVADATADDVVVAEDVAPAAAVAAAPVSTGISTEQAIVELADMLRYTPGKIADARTAKRQAASSVSRLNGQATGLRGKAQKLRDGKTNPTQKDVDNLLAAGSPDINAAIADFVAIAVGQFIDVRQNTRGSTDTSMAYATDDKPSFQQVVTDLVMAKAQGKSEGQITSDTANALEAIVAAYVNVSEPEAPAEGADDITRANYDRDMRAYRREYEDARSDLLGDMQIALRRLNNQEDLKAGLDAAVKAAQDAAKAGAREAAAQSYDAEAAAIENGDELAGFVATANAVVPSEGNPYSRARRREMLAKIAAGAFNGERTEKLQGAETTANSIANERVDAETAVPADVFAGDDAAVKAREIGSKWNTFGRDLIKGEIVAEVVGLFGKAAYSLDKGDLWFDPDHFVKANKNKLFVGWVFKKAAEIEAARPAFEPAAAEERLTA
ncbi:MAG: hypothetical protein AB7G06_00530 [Bdellovibrionales bacterium]